MKVTLRQPLTPDPSPHPMGRGEIYFLEPLPGVTVSRPYPGLISGCPFRALETARKPRRVRGSHPFKYNDTKQRAGSGEGETGRKPGFPSLTAIGLALEEKMNPGATVGDDCARGVNPGVLMTSVFAPTAPAMTFAVPAATIIPPVILLGVTGWNIRHRPADRHGCDWHIDRRGRADHGRGYDHDGWRTIDRRGRRGDHHGRGRINHRRPDRNADGPTGVGLGGKRRGHPDDSDYDQCFSFHSCQIRRCVQRALQAVEKGMRCFAVNELREMEV